MAGCERLVLFVGSGFSCNLGLPTTGEIQDRMLEVEGDTPAEAPRERFISSVIMDFWQQVFGWAPSRPRPSLEDHFTQIDLAANSGHYLGGVYGPKKLRALRRMTIHRAFKLLDVPSRPGAYVDRSIRHLSDSFALSVVTTNWDIMVERSLERLELPFFDSNQVDVLRPPAARTGVPIWKLHGSSNWGYCDLCRTQITSEIGLGKAALKFGWLLESDDFRLFDGGEDLVSQIGEQIRECPSCRGRIGTRLATFSYRKHLDVPFLQSVWDEARTSLRLAERWLFIGYSMPEADVEIRHLLKTAELARPNSMRPHIEVILKSDRDGSFRFERLFGSSLKRIHNHGLESWAERSLLHFCDVS